MNNFVNILVLFLMLLNPFLLVIYLRDLLQKQDFKNFSYHLISAGILSWAVFSIFAVLGDTLFKTVLQVEFESFRIFGGIVFLFIAMKFIFNSSTVLSTLRADSQFISTNIAMPIMIGPGTISISVLAGQKLPVLKALIAVALATTGTVLTVILLKLFHDFISRRNSKLVEQYFELAGKITALILGTYAIEMIMTGLRFWLAKT